MGNAIVPNVCQPRGRTRLAACYDASSSGFAASGAGDTLTTIHVTAAASAITQAMKATMPSSPKNVSTCSVE